jgi:hypothetical protein
MQGNLSDKKFSYLELNRGRYLCPDHGGFCDSVDNYQVKCPLCGTMDPLKHWQINKVDRLLQVVNGLQNRSKRNVALLASLIGGIGLLRLASALGNSDGSLLTSDWAKALTFFAVACLLLSLSMYGASMPHIRTMQKQEQPTRTVNEWEKSLGAELFKMERWHKRAGLLFGMSTALLAIAVLVQMFASVQWCKLLPS